MFLIEPLHTKNSESIIEKSTIYTYKGVVRSRYRYTYLPTYYWVSHDPRAGCSISVYVVSTDTNVRRLLSYGLLVKVLTPV